ARRAARHRHRPRSGAGLPRQLFDAGQFHAVAGLRGRHHRLRPGRGDRHRDRVEAAVRHSPDRRRADRRARCLPAAVADEQGIPLPRSLRHCAIDRHRGLLCDPGRGRGAAGRRDAEGLRALEPDLHQSGDALHRHRHHRRDGDAAQSLSAFLDRADPRLSAHRRGPPRRHQVGDDGLDDRADAGAVHQRRDPGGRGRDLPQERPQRCRRDRPGVRAAVAAARARHRLDPVR
ncbi:hypothetical protein KXV85_001884, partial [Aspergillus fumigatus]